MGKGFTILFWDVDQTLLDFTKSQEYALRAAFEKWGKEISGDVVLLYQQVNDSWWKRLELGEVAKSQLLTGRFHDLFEILKIHDIELQPFAEYYQKKLGSVFYYLDDSYELCCRLKKRVRQYAVTNGVSATQRSKLCLSGLDKWMDDIFISEEIGPPKPSLDFFNKCFERIDGFSKERALIVGDSLTSDIKGGNQAGIACCWYNPKKITRPGGLRIDYEIRNLWEVEDIVDGKKREPETEAFIFAEDSFGKDR